MNPIREGPHRPDLAQLFAQCPIVELKSQEQWAAIEELLDALVDAQLLISQSKPAIIRRLREQDGGWAGAAAMPHLSSTIFETPLVIFGRSRDGVRWNAVDHLPIRIVFLVFCPDNQPGNHLFMTARVSQIMRNEVFFDFACRATDTAELKELLDAAFNGHLD